MAWASPPPVCVQVAITAGVIVTMMKVHRYLIYACINQANERVTGSPPTLLVTSKALLRALKVGTSMTEAG